MRPKPQPDPMKPHCLQQGRRRGGPCIIAMRLPSNRRRQYRLRWDSRLGQTPFKIGVATALGIEEVDREARRQEGDVSSAEEGAHATPTWVGLPEVDAGQGAARKDPLSSRRGDMIGGKR